MYLKPVIISLTCTTSEKKFNSSFNNFAIRHKTNPHNFKL